MAEKEKHANQQILSKITNKQLVRNLVEKMRISGTNQWTAVDDVVSTPAEREALELMAGSRLLDRSQQLVRFADARTFRVVAAELAK